MEYRVDPKLRLKPYVHVGIDAYDAFGNIRKCDPITIPVGVEDLIDADYLAPADTLELANEIAARLNEAEALKVSRGEIPATNVERMVDEETTYAMRMQEYLDEVDDYAEHCNPY